MRNGATRKGIPPHPHPHNHPPDGPKVVIGATVMGEVTRAKKSRGIISRPEYAHCVDGLDALMAAAALYYAIQGKDFADEAYLSQNFRQAELRSRDLQIARVGSREIPSDQRALGEYQMAYRS